MGKMYLMVENLVNSWDQVKIKFKAAKILKDKNLLIAMMYQSWELCDDVFTKWIEANKTTLPAKGTLCVVAAKHLFSV